MSEDTIELPDGMDLGTAKDVLREFATTDEAQIVSADTLSAKDEQIDELAGVFRDALMEQKDLSEAAVDGMTVDALTAEFRDDNGDLKADTLAQSPEAGTGGGSGGSDATGWDTLGNSEREDVKDKLRRADLMADRTPDHADTLRQEAAEMAGVDEWETLESEVSY